MNIHNNGLPVVFIGFKNHPNPIQFMRFIIFAFGLLVFSALAQAQLPTSGSASTDSVLYFDQTILKKHLENMTAKDGKTEDTFELKLWQDGLNKRPVAPSTEVEVKVEVKIPKTGALLSDAARLSVARSGCVADFKDGKITVTLKKPQIFVDPTGASAATWRYEIAAELKKSGAGAAQANGVLVRTGRICVSTFGIKSKRTDEPWRPAENPSYTYSIDVRPENEWKELGRLDQEAAMQKGGDGMAHFYWNEGTEGKSIFVRWKIESEYTVTEETEWTQLTNPGTLLTVTEEKPGEAATATPLPSTPSSQASVFGYDQADKNHPFFTVNSMVDNEEKANVRSSATSNLENIISRFPQGIVVQQTGPEIAGPDGIVWVPVRHLNDEKSREWKGYISKKYLKRKS